MKKIISILLALLMVLNAAAPSVYADELESNSIEFEWTRSFSYGTEHNLRDDAYPVTDSNDNVYVIDKYGYVQCIGPDRELRYSVNIYQERGKGSAVPTVDGKGNAYAASSDKKIYSIDSQGRVRWTVDMKEQAAVSHVGVIGERDGKTVFYASDINGRIYAVDTDSGKLLWNTEFVIGFGTSSPSLSSDGKTIYVAGSSLLAAYDTSLEKIKDEDRQIWIKSPEKEGITSYPIARFDAASFNMNDNNRQITTDEEGNIYFVTIAARDNAMHSDENYIHKFNAEGEQQWRLSAGNAGVYANAPVSYNGALYYKNSNNEIYRITENQSSEPSAFLVYKAANMGTALSWDLKYPLNISQYGIVYVAMGNSYSADIYVVDLNDGQLLRKTGAGTQRFASEAGPSGVVYAMGTGRLDKFRDTSVKQVPEAINFIDGDEDYTLRTGSLYQPGIEVKDERGLAINKAQGMVLESSDEGIVKIEGMKIRAVNAGTAQVRAYIEGTGLSCVSSVTVVDSIVSAEIEIVYAKNTVETGNRLDLSAEIKIGEKPLRGENVLWSSGHEHIATVDSNGSVTGIREGTAKITAYAAANEGISSYIAVYVQKTEIKQITHEEIKDALTKSMNYYRGRGILGDWDVFAVNAAGVDPLSIDPQYIERTKLAIKNNGGSAGGGMTDYERIAIGLMSAGADVTNFVYDDALYASSNGQSGYIDFIKEITDGTAGGGIGQGINAVIFGLITLNGVGSKADEYTGPINKSFLVDYIINPQNKSGAGWAFGGGSTLDPDMTGMAMYALAPYYFTRNDVKSSVDEAVNWLSNEGQLSNGRFGSWGTVNSSSLSQVIMGLVSIGIDPQNDERFIKPGGNALTALMSYYLGDGTFAYTTIYDPNFGTPQGIQALASINNYLKNKENSPAGRGTAWENIVWAGSGDIGDIKNISILPGNVVLDTNQTIKLTVITDVGNVISSDMEYSTNNSDVASVTNEGEVTAKALGTAKVSVKYIFNEKEYTSYIEVTVKDRNLFSVYEDKSVTVTGYNNLYMFSCENTSDINQDVVFIVNLYDKMDDSTVDQINISTRFMPKEKQLLGASFQVPQDGEYYIKVMLWDSLANIRSLKDAITIQGVE
nr:Ig-like domain-containing protein [Sedimentibacter sp.]